MNYLCCIYLLLAKTLNVASADGVKHENRIFGGSKVNFNSSSNWPWTVAFITREGKFFCAGTLIGRQYVLSAAHCFHPKKLGKRESYDFVVSLGQLDLEKVDNESKYEVEDIFVHPDWKTDETSYDADIAIVKLMKSVKLSVNISTLSFKSDREFIRGGFVVGWGYSEISEIDGSTHVTKARELPIRAVRNEDCFLEFPEIAKISSRRTFCGGWPGFKANVCRGDSGGGFYIRSKDKWLVQGVVSSSYLIAGKMCNVDQYAVFTRVSSFSSWITMIMMQDENKISYSNPISMDCKLLQSGKVCRVANFDINGNGVEVVSSNSYTYATPNLKVTKIIIAQQNVFMVPLGLKRLFPNLSSLVIDRSELQSLSRKGVAGLNGIAVPGNKIVEIPIDAFWDCPNLTNLNLNKNEIRKLDENLFIHSPNLIYFEANKNKIEHLPRDLFRDTLQLELVSLAENLLSVIDVDFFKIRSILEIDLRQNECTNSTYLARTDHISQFKFHINIATNCSRSGLYAHSRNTQVIK